jgi:hypothetical protein
MSTETGKSIVLIGRGITMPQNIKAKFEIRDEDFQVAIELDVKATQMSGQRPGRLICERLAVTSLPPGGPVTFRTLSRIPVAELIRLAGVNEWQKLDSTGGSKVTSTKRVRMSDAMVKQLRAEGPSDETLGWVALTYTLALIFGDSPTRAVEKAFSTHEGDLPQSTAGRWVSLARRRGFLGPSEGPGKVAG